MAKPDKTHFYSSIKKQVTQINFLFTGLCSGTNFVQTGEGKYIESKSVLIYIVLQ